MVRSKIATEFGGEPGLTQPAPSPLSAAEQMRVMRATEAADPADSPDAALIRELEIEGRL